MCCHHNHIGINIFCKVQNAIFFYRIIIHIYSIVVQVILFGGMGQLASQVAARLKCSRCIYVNQMQTRIKQLLEILKRIHCSAYLTSEIRSQYNFLYLKVRDRSFYS